MTLTVGIAGEDSEEECRIVLRPQEAALLARQKDIKVCVERDAGALVGFPNESYAKVGAEIVDETAIWGGCDAVVKFKSPSIHQLSLCRSGVSVIAKMHAERSLDYMKKLLESRVNAYAFEFLTKDGKTFPAMEASSGLTAYQAFAYGMFYAQNPPISSFPGKVYGRTPDGNSANVLVIGYGNIGRKIAELSLAVGCKVSIAHWNDNYSVGSMSCINVHDSNFRKLVTEADVIFFCLRISTYDSEALITRDMVLTMRPGAVIVDVTAGFGAGCIETSDTVTTLHNPVRVIENVTHIKIRNFPRPLYSQSVDLMSKTLIQLVLSWCTNLIDADQESWIRTGMIISDGKIIHPIISKAWEKKDELRSAI